MKDNILNEMARFGSKINLSKEIYDIELHGGIDRIYPPHIHLYKTSERKFDNKTFTIEINFANFLSTGDVDVCRIRKDSKDLDVNKNYTKFLKVFEKFEEFLYQKPTVKDFVSFDDNISVAIHIFNEEADMKQLHDKDKERFQKEYPNEYLHMKSEYKFIFVMLSMKMKIANQFRKYFSEDIQNKFPKAFY